jgi:hypothetical protein
VTQTSTSRNNRPRHGCRGVPRCGVPP